MILLENLKIVSYLGILADLHKKLSCLLTVRHAQVPSSDIFSSGYSENVGDELEDAEDISSTFKWNLNFSVESKQVSHLVVSALNL